MNSKAPGGTRTHVAALRVRSPRRWTTSATLGLGPEGLEPSPTRLRAGRSATRASVPNDANNRPIANANVKRRRHSLSNRKARCFLTPGLHQLACEIPDGPG